MDFENSMMWSGVILLVACSCLVGCCKFAHFVREAEEDWYESAREPNIVKAKGPNEKQIRILNESIPVHQAEREEICAICLDEILIGQDCRELKCGHIFHADCMYSWWASNARQNRLEIRCSTCRRSQTMAEAEMAHVSV